MFRLYLIKLLFRLLKVPIGSPMDNEKIKEWLGFQYPVQGFRNYVSMRSLQILQQLGEQVSWADYLIYLGQRIELGKLLTESKINFEKAEAKKNKKQQQNENVKNK